MPWCGHTHLSLFHGWGNRLLRVKEPAQDHATHKCKAETQTQICLILDPQMERIQTGSGCLFSPQGRVETSSINCINFPITSPWFGWSCMSGRLWGRVRLCVQDSGQISSWPIASLLSLDASDSSPEFQTFCSPRKLDVWAYSFLSVLFPTHSFMYLFTNSSNRE